MEWHVALGAAALVAAVLSIPNPRGILWVGLIALSYALTTLYADAGWPYPPFASGFADLALAAVILWSARERWELWLGTVYMFSLLVNIVFFGTQQIDPQTAELSRAAYVMMLESCNWAALAWIGGAGITRMISDGSAAPGRPRGWLYRSLFSPRTALD